MRILEKNEVQSVNGGSLIGKIAKTALSAAKKALSEAAKRMVKPTTGNGG